MRYLITFSYDGSSFKGYQRQKNLKTVQGSIEEVLSKLNNKKVNITSSGRTDIGVHALNQKAHFDLDINITPSSIKKVLNKNLDGIYIKDIKIVDNDFHARYFVTNKTYSYYINTLEYNVLQRNYVYQLNKKLDINRMEEALKLLLGKHDFRGFCFQNKEKENTIREIYDYSISENCGIIKISITGNGFLRKMVRNIMGTLIEIAMYKKDIDEISKILDNKGKYHNKKCVPGCGLYLENVGYRSEIND